MGAADDMSETRPVTLQRRNGVDRRENVLFKLLCLGWLLLCVFVSLGVVVVYRERSERARLVARMTKLQAEGSPVDDASLEALYHARTSTEMLTQWNKIFELVKTESESSASGEDQALMQRPGELRTEIALAVSSDRPCRFIEEFEATYTLLPYLSRLRATTKLLASDAQAAIRCGDIDTAIEDCELMLGCADAISADPFAIPAMVSISFQNNTLDIYRTCLEDNLLSESQLNALLKTCRSRGAIGDRWKLLISGERAMTLALLTDDVHEESLAVQDPYFHWLGVSGRGANNIADFFDKLEAVPIDDLQNMASSAEFVG